MGCVIEIPAVTKTAKTEIILFPENDMYYLVKEYLGDDAAKIYDEMLTELQDYREKEKNE